MPRLFDWLNDPQRQAKIIGARLNAEFDNLRDRLDADRTYFVSTGGSDSNTGLTAGSAFGTIQKALDTVWNRLDIGPHVVTIQLADGTYVETAYDGNYISGPNTATYPGYVILQGNTADNDAVHINNTTRGIWAKAGAQIYVEHVKITAADGAFLATDFSNIGYGQVVFGPTTVHNYCLFHSQIYAYDVYEIAGSANAHIDIDINCSFIIETGVITLTGTPAWSVAFALVRSESHMHVGNGTAFSGGATGKKFDLRNGGTVNVPAGSGESYFPGDAVGTIIQGGAYEDHQAVELLSVGDEPSTRISVGGALPTMQIAQDADTLWMQQFIGTGGGTGTNFSSYVRTANASPAGGTAVATGTSLQETWYFGDDGNSYETAAFSRVRTAGTISNGVMPGMFDWFTSPDSSATPARRLMIDRENVVVGNAAIATNATDGFLYVPTCAGTPTGTPTAYAGMAPIVVNTTNNKLYFYSGGAWRDAGP